MAQATGMTLAALRLHAAPEDKSDRMLRNDVNGATRHFNRTDEGKPEVGIWYTCADLRLAARMPWREEHEVEEIRLDGVRRARALAEKVAEMAAPGFATWVYEAQPGVCYAPKFVYDRLCRGRLRLTPFCIVSEKHPRESFALLRDVAGMAYD